MGPGRRRDDEGTRAARWGRALARLRSAEAEVAAAEGADDAAFDRALGRFNGALVRLLRTPAPDVAALAVKLDLVVAHEVWELAFAPASLAALCRDARRMAAVGPARACNGRDFLV